MTLPVSGNVIKFSQINTELGLSSTAAINFSNTVVRTLLGVPSGVIKISDGYGKSNRTAIAVTYSSTTQAPTITVNSLGGYVAGKSDITITVNSGVVLYGNPSTTSPGLTIAGTSASGDTITLINNGRILGYGGDGALGGQVGTSGSISPGPNGPYQASNGGDALKVTVTTTIVSITNNGTIAAGGGGGGGGGGYYPSPYGHGGGGGGGQGYPGGTADPLGGSYNIFGTIPSGTAGTSGSDSAAGTYGNGVNGAGRGGAGGAYGASGSSGTDSSQTDIFLKGYGSGGGRSGYYVNGVSKVSFVVNGTRLGLTTG
jgi:hypothetical protein